MAKFFFFGFIAIKSPIWAILLNYPPWRPLGDSNPSYLSENEVS